MADDPRSMPEWERLLAAERHLQHLVDGTVLVGGTAAALHAGHRVSVDGDHVKPDLRDEFDHVLQALEAAAGWRTERVQRPVLILEQLDGVLTGIRQLRRTRPLETEVIEGLRVPTLAEMARIKAWLLATRYTVRDYLDTIVLFERLGEAPVRAALREFDAIYRQPNESSPLSEVAERLAAARPRDQGEVELATYRGLRPPWNDWEHVVSRGREWAARLARSILEDRVGREPLARSRALWNRSSLDLASDETLAQLLDRGELEAWRAIYALASDDPALRRRVLRIVRTVPIGFPHFWLAAMASLGEPIDHDVPLPEPADGV